MSRRTITGLGLVAAGGVGYYLYQAGGDPKVARKEVEHDMTSATSRAKGEKVSAESAKKQGEEWAARAGSKIDSTIDDARSKVHEADSLITRKAGQAESKLDQLKHDSAASFDRTRKEAENKIEEFDNKVEKKTSEAKGGISSWLGFGK
ncbi:MAG: hypothetical protein Q9217_005285 [Psora testacea]